MEAPNGEYNYTRLERVIFGPGKVEVLAHELDRRGLKRGVVITGKTLGASKLLDKVTGALGSRCAAVYKGAQQHVPLRTVRELVDEIKRVEGDCLISFGGGSPIDTAKVAAEAILNGRKVGDAHGIDFHSAMNKGDSSGDLVEIAIPTTLSAGEYTPVGGVTNEATRIKGGVGDPRLQPRTIINDPTLTIETPDWLWVATGMRAFDHAVEAIYSIRHQLIADTLATKAIALLVEHLPASIKTKGNETLAHRGFCQMAAWFSIFGGMNTRFGVSHALGHQIGPKWDVAHGVTSCITMPHAMRFMAEIAPQRFGPIAEGLGVRFDSANPRVAALECADRVARFIAQFDVPHTLKDAGVPRGEIHQIAATVLDEVEHSKVVDRSVTREEIVGLLEAAHAG
ncbi:MAG TPA: iron-containing alcohol dehydrogenase [Candidatus Binataceae bacterium]|nr:iron-containing alcohol dehydrogenase [Candidatus Binataceae bacterium]